MHTSPVFAFQACEHFGKGSDCHTNAGQSFSRRTLCYPTLAPFARPSAVTQSGQSDRQWVSVGTEVGAVIRLWVLEDRNHLDSCYRNQAGLIPVCMVC